MGLYRRVVLPRLLDAMMSMPALSSHRRRLLSSVKGKVLEIGFGTGANLPYYPKHVKKITAVDSNEAISAIGAKRIEALHLEVEYLVLDAEELPFANGAFDSVVTTWTLCSVSDPERVLREIARVLKPDGHLYFLEHGISPEKSTARWQRLLCPANRALAGGCELTRDIPALVKAAGFGMESLEQYYIQHVPRTHGYMSQGIALVPR